MASVPSTLGFPVPMKTFPSIPRGGPGAGTPGSGATLQHVKMHPTVSDPPSHDIPVSTVSSPNEVMARPNRSASISLSLPPPASLVLVPFPSAPHHFSKSARIGSHEIIGLRLEHVPDGMSLQDGASIPFQHRQITTLACVSPETAAKVSNAAPRLKPTRAPVAVWPPYTQQDAKTAVARYMSSPTRPTKSQTTPQPAMLSGLPSKAAPGESSLAPCSATDALTHHTVLPSQGHTRDAAVLAASSLHGPRLVAAMQSIAALDDIKVAAHGEKNARTLLSTLATRGIESALLDAQPSPKGGLLHIDCPRGNPALLPVVPVVAGVSPGGEAGGLFFLRPGVKVTGLALCTLRSKKWDGLYHLRNFSNSALDVLFGIGWDAGVVTASAAPASVAVWPTTPAAAAASRGVLASDGWPVPAKAPRLKKQARVTAELSLPHRLDFSLVTPEAGLGGAIVATGKRKAAQPTSDGSSRDAFAISGSLLFELRRRAPALLNAAQCPAATTLISWPHGDSRAGREALCVLAQRGITVAQTSAPLWEGEFHSLILRRARVGNSSDVSFMPVLPIFGDTSAGSAGDAIICYSVGRPVVGLAVVLKRADMWKQHVAFVPVQRLSPAQLDELFSDDFATHGRSEDGLDGVGNESILKQRGAQDAILSATVCGVGNEDDDEASSMLRLAELLQHAQRTAVLTPLSPFSSCPVPLDHSSSEDNDRYTLLQSALASVGPSLVQSSSDPEATTLISLACASPRKDVRLCTLSASGVTPEMLVLLPCSFLHDLDIQRTRCGGKRHGPFPIVPVLQKNPALPALFYHSDGSSVVDLALVFKTNASWRDAKLVSLQALSDAQLSLIIGSDWLQNCPEAACSYADVSLARVTKSVFDVPPASIHERAESASSLMLPPDFLRLLVLASQQSSVNAVLCAPDTFQSAPLNAISRRGVKVGHLSAQYPSGFTLCQIQLVTESTFCGIFPVVPIDEAADSKSPGFYHSTGFAHGAAVALKPIEAQWCDGPIVWVDVRYLLPAHLIVLRQTAEQLLDAEVASDNGDDGGEGLSCFAAAMTPSATRATTGLLPPSFTTPECLHDADPKCFEISIRTLPLVPASSLLKSAPLGHDAIVASESFGGEDHSPSAADTFLREMCRRAQALGVVPADSSASHHFSQLLQEAIIFGANYDANTTQTTSCRR